MAHRGLRDFYVSTASIKSESSRMTLRGASFLQNTTRI